MAAEFAIVKVRTTQLDSAAENTPPKLLAAAKKVTNNLDNYLAATQLGVTIASLALGYVAEDAMQNLLVKLFNALHINMSVLLLHRISGIVGFIIITMLHIVFGELAPKTIAIRKATQTTFVVAYPLGIFYFICRPFIWMLNKMSNIVLSIFGIEPTSEQDIHTEEEIKLIVSESGESGAIEDSERELINKVFEFDSQRVREIQVHRKDLAALDLSESKKEIFKKMVEEGYSRYPVYHEKLNDLKGIIYTKDILRQFSMGSDIENINFESVLRPIYYIPDSMKIKDLLKSLQKSHLQMAIVTDEYGDISGIVTMEDILEELVGDIQDEHDTEVPIVEEQTDGSYIVLAHETIDDINELLVFPLEEDDHYNTLSGLITYNHGSIPSEGEDIELESYHLKILKMYRSSVEKVQMWLKPDLKEQLDAERKDEDDTTEENEK